MDISSSCITVSYVSIQTAVQNSEDLVYHTVTTPVTTHVIANVFQIVPVLPLIDISIANLDATILLDTGS